MKHQAVMGIELGSTRIKAVLVDDHAEVLAQGSYEWENSLIDGYWTYSLDEVWVGLRESYRQLNDDYRTRYGEELTELRAIGISAMMHGYLAFDREGTLLVPFRTWRNTATARSAKELSELFCFNVPQRWSVAHYDQAVLNGEEHVARVDFLTTLAGYVHYKLTGKKVLGMGDASGMFPIRDGQYDAEMLALFNERLRAHGMEKAFESVLPKILLAGEDAGTLTEEGAALLDPTGKLRAGCKLCPPEGDAGTGMMATNSIAPRTANVSAGTSAFLMAVLERNLQNYYEEIDVVTTPVGSPVAMVHVNNFTSEINAWMSLFEEVIALGGGTVDRGALFDAAFRKSREGDADCGGLTGYNFLSGEHIVGVTEGRPLVARLPDGALTLANFMKMQIYSALGTLSIGMDILRKEQVALDSVCGHGGFFKTERVGQSAMSAALGAPITVMKNAGEGGAFGVALLALFTARGGDDLAAFLDELFRDTQKTTVEADAAERSDFARFAERYRKGLAVERLASEIL